MKARVKATGEIVEVVFNGFYYESMKDGRIFDNPQLEILSRIKDPDYWDKLLHQYAGMAMQGMVKTYEQMMRADLEYKMNHFTHADAELANGVLISHAEDCAEFCVLFATALVEKLKESKE